MLISPLSVLSAVLVIPVAPGTYSCTHSLCELPDDSSLLAHYAYFAECMTGPVGHRPNSCFCADLNANAHVSLRDFAAFQIAPVFVCERYLLITHETAHGNCLIPGVVNRAGVIPALNGGLVFVGSLVAEGNSTTDECIPWIGPPECYIVRPFSPITLTMDEQNELSNLLSAIPEVGCQPDCTAPCTGECCGYVDPCVIWRIRDQGEWRDDNCYGNGNAAEYRLAITHVQELLNGLLIRP